ncbi:hypothetical protein Adeg_0694 [Ammonifex degensii KC4]|uniref:DUF1640 domain-containing protein n=1 Tax=Ammonifex degensii (strain DSM 10501 / KC4) TaxID=429009 RepID=C9RC64_AMMDK|nr:hypothetical protein [Ammonifex degensii]ACX51841.1 hypothetical protein Adeg_0694 [Ammonifex degensii KC4]
MSTVTEEARREEIPRLNPWDVIAWKLDSLEKYVQREIESVRREIESVRREVGDVRRDIAELRQEVKEMRRSFSILEWTAILGFLAVIATIVAVKLWG